MSTKPEAGSPDELPWLRGFEEARNHFLAKNAEDMKMFLSEHDENVRLHFENVDLKEQNARLREALESLLDRSHEQHCDWRYPGLGQCNCWLSKAHAALEGE